MLVPQACQPEGLGTLVVVKAQPRNAGPGRTTAVQDAAWSAALRRHGLWRGRVMPAKPPRQRRELTRHRPTRGQDRARLSHRVPAVLEEATIPWASVVTEIRGVSARAMLEALLAGHRDVTARAALARGRRRAKRAPREEAWQGACTPPHRGLLTASCSPRDDGDDAMARVSVVLAQALEAAQEAIAWLDTMPGGRQRTVESLLADVGTERTRFPTAHPRASWAGMCPGHDDRGGTRLSGKTRPGRRWWRQVLVEGAPVAATTQPTDLAAQYPRMAARRGTKRALRALGHTSVGSVEALLPRTQPSQDRGTTSVDSLTQQRVERRRVRRWERLGSQVS